MNNFVNTLFSEYDGKTVTAIFKNGARADHPARIFDLLKTDDGTECIYDTETGEVLFAR